MRVAKTVKKVSPWTLGAIVVVLVAFGMRVWLALVHWPELGGDEAVMNLMALHVLEKGEHPVFFYGQSYMGAIEAYPGAILFRLFGPSFTVMRVEMAGFFACFLFTLYQLTAHLYTRAFACCVIVVMSVGSLAMVNFQLLAPGGYPELPVIGALAFLLAYTLVASPQLSRKRKVVVYLLWGLVVGVGLWDDLLIAPYLLMSGIVLIFQWKELLRWAVWVVALGVIVGAFPLIYYNLTCAPGTDSLTTFLHLSTMGTPKHDPLWVHIQNTALVSLPAMTGLQLHSFVRSISSTQPHAHRALFLQFGWSIGYGILLLLALGMACVMLLRTRNMQGEYEIRQQERMRQATRVLLALSAVVTLVFYIKGSAPVLDDYHSARYLVPLWISTPVVLSSLWFGIGRIRGPQIVNLSLWTMRLAAIAVVFVLIALSMAQISQHIPGTQADYQQQSDVVAQLEAMHIQRFYSEYWTCNRLILLSQEKLVCVDTWVEHGTFGFGLNRYHPYQTMVAQQQNPAYVYPLKDSHIATLEQLAKAQHIAFKRTVIENVVVYQLVTPLAGTKL